MNAEEQVRSKLEASRKELLDLSLRNSLLNYRTLRPRGVEITNELPTEVFRILVREGKRMSFLPAPETSLFQSPSDGESLSKGSFSHDQYTDYKLQTNETAKRLEARLLDTFYTARTFIEGQGVNVLFLSLGMLNWYEAETSQERRRAPLVLVPVELERSTVGERFRLRYTEAEVDFNLSLVAKMNAEFDICIPVPAETEEFDIENYFSQVAVAIEGQPRWSVDESAVALGFFSFSKFMMYRDLDTATWPTDAQPTAHPIIRSLLLDDGFSEPQSLITDEEHLDKHLTPAATRHVVDADSSQTLAIFDVNQGRNLVVQGPPGTGKSQTITNIIAEAIGQGKSVLFVAEKMAALDVVKRNLDKIGLGVACLELHSHKANKKELLKELAKTRELSKPKLAQAESEISLLNEVRNRINAYCDAINTSVGATGVAPHAAYGKLLRLRKDHQGGDLPRIPLPGLLTWTQEEFKRREALVKELQARLATTGVPRKLAFWGSRRKVFLPTEEGRLAELLVAARTATVTLRECSIQLASSLGFPTPTKRIDSETIAHAAQRAMQSPHLHGITLRTNEWQSNRDDVRKLIEAGMRLADLHRQYDEILIPDAWQQDLLETRQNLAAYGRKWWRILSGAYRRSQNKLAGLCRTPLPKEIDEQINLVDAVLEANRQKQIVNEYEELGARLFGSQWQSERSDWQVLARIFEWIIQLYHDVGDGKLPQAIIDFLAGEPNLTKLEPEVIAVEKALAEHGSDVRKVIEALEFDEGVRFGAGERIENQSYNLQEEVLRDWHERSGDLHLVAAWNNIAETAEREGLSEVVKLSESWAAAGRLIAPAFEQTWLEAILENAFTERPALRTFERASHEEVIRKFKQLDSLSLEINRAKVAFAHWQRLPQQTQQGGGGQLGVLLNEINKKSRHLEIRQLMAKAGNAVQAIKPVFMMSPLSISKFLPPGTVKFDLVIFDEASQVKPVDALGAISRGHQVVVVGDSKQLPPTSFFDSLIKDEAADEETATGDVESILGLFAARNAPQRMLRWHYRSRHESLIAVSNYLFYDNRLIVFPSPDADRREVGLIYHHLPHTAYDRGGTRTNLQEAEAVAKAVIEHTRVHPELTLGVAAFSRAQMQAIHDKLKVLGDENPECKEFFAAHPHEPFRIKNLEEIQGDERDVIMISIGYGRSATRYMSMNFGPLNNDGGERRMNVLITRARLRCEVFTNLTADDIELERSDARGVHALKTFLDYAQNGKLDIPVVSGRAMDSPFEIAVYTALTACGYQLKPQVGSAGFFIDLAVVDPRLPGRYLLGIECDGASYHSARSARDRDRLRQQVLEDLGWRIHRIWSTDWFRYPERELKRAAAAIEEARTYSPTTRNASPPQNDDLRKERKDSTHNYQAIEREAALPTPLVEDVPAYTIARLPIKLGTQELHTVPTAQLALWITEVVRIESPAHISEVTKRIADAAGVARAGARIRASIEAACTTAVSARSIRRQGDFLWSEGMHKAPLRDRGNLPVASRKIEFVAPEELGIAINKVVAETYGIEFEQIPAFVARLLGFARMSDDMRQRIEAAIHQMLATRYLIEQGGHVTTGEGTRAQRG